MYERGGRFPYSLELFHGLGVSTPTNHTLALVSALAEAALLLELAMIMSEQTKPGEPVEAPAASAAEQVPDWLGNRLKRMFTDVMAEPVPDEFKDLLKQLEDKERGA